MSYGFIFNAIICLLIFATSIIAAVKIFRVNAKNKTDLSFGVFWLLFALVWLFFGLNSTFAFLGLKTPGLISVYIYETFLFFLFLPLAYYIPKKLTKNTRLISLLMLVYIIIIISSLYLLFQYRFIEIQENFFERAYLLNNNIIYLFALLFLPLFLFTVIYFIKIIKTRKIPADAKIHELLVTISLFLGGIIGFLDQTDLIVGWPALTARLLIVIAPFLAYFAYSDYNYQNKGQVPL